MDVNGTVGFSTSVNSPIFQGQAAAATFGNASYETTVAGSGLTISPTSWTATPTISGLITATGGLTANGALTANNAFTLGDDGDTGAINTSDWDISTIGAMTGISGIANNGAYTQSGTDANTFAGTATFSNVTYSALFTGGNVGVGTATPDALLAVGSLTAKSTDPAISIARSISTAANAHGFMDSSIFTGASGMAYAAYDSFFESAGANNLNHLIGFQSRHEHAGAGTLSKYYSFGSFPNNTGGRITDLYHYYATDVIGGSAVTNQYGIYVANLTGADNNYSIYTGNGPVSLGAAATIRSGGLTLDSGAVTVTNSSTPLDVTRTTDLLTGNITLARLRATSSGQMADGFGTMFAFAVKDADGTSYDLGVIGAVRSGADNSGALAMGTSNAGAYSEKMRITPSGSVGIGTASPGGKLEVSESTAVNLYPLFTARGDNGLTSSVIFRTLTGAGVNSGGSIGHDGNAELLFLGYGTGGGSTKNMVINSSGNVGIGTTAPDDLLHLYRGNLRFEGNDNLGDGDYLGKVVWENMDTSHLLGIVGSMGWKSFSANGTHQRFALNVGTAWNDNTQIEALTVLVGGNVGIGTTSPGAKLDVKQTNDAFGNGIRLQNVAGNKWEFAMDSSNKLWLGYNPGTTAAMVLDSTGNVGIGTTGPAQRLAIVGSGITSSTASLNVMNASSTSALFVLDSGNVGIGTTGPTAKLDVAGNIVLSGNFNRTISVNPGSDTDTSLDIDVNSVVSTQDALVRLFRSTNTSGARSLQIFRGDNSTSLQTLLNAYGNSYINALSGNVGIGTASPGTRLDVVGGFRAGNATSTNGLVFDQSSGNVGIGTAVPANKLEVVGSGASQSILVAQSDTGSLADGQSVIFGNALGTNTAGNLLRLRSAGVDRLVVAASTGNVGIGTTAPGARLEVSSAGDVTAKIASSLETSSYARLYLLGRTSGGAVNDWRLVADNGGAINGFSIYGGNGTSLDTRLVILGSGNVGIGTTGPLFKLDVSGTFRATATSTFAANVGIGTTAPAYPLDVLAAGTGVIARFTSDNNTSCGIDPNGGTITCSSDSRLKKNIEDLPYGLNEIMALRPVAFNWNSQAEGADKNMGFIAQEVETVLPKLVTTDQNGYKSLRGFSQITSSMI